MKEILKSFNSWWVTQHVDPMLGGIERSNYINEIKEVLNRKEVIELTGIRRAGKTTVMYQIIDNLIKSGINPANILFVQLDDENLQLQIKNVADPIEKVISEYLQWIKPEGKIYLFLDEVQVIKHFGGFIKRFYETKPNYKFIISGSNANLLEDESTRKLVGRVYKIKVTPFSFNQILEMKKIEYKNTVRRDENIIKGALNDYLQLGGFPEVVLEDAKNPNIIKNILKEYLRGILQKDIIEVYSIRDANLLLELATYLVIHIGNKTNERALGNLLSSNKNTISDYSEYLLKSNAFIKIPHYSHSYKGTIRKDRKYYIRDLGLYSAFSYDYEEGFVVENAVLLKLLERFENVYYWQGRNECDFVINEQDQKIGIEVKYQKQERDVDGLIEAIGKLDLKMGVVVTKDIEKEENKEGKKIKYVPLWKFLLDL